MYITMADLLNAAAKDDASEWCSGTAQETPSALATTWRISSRIPWTGDSPQSRLINALINFEKPIVAAVHGFAIGGGTTMLTHCDFVYAGESAKFQMPFINLALVPEFGSSYSIPARIGYLRAAELIQLGQPFDAARSGTRACDASRS